MMGRLVIAILLLSGDSLAQEPVVIGYLTVLSFSSVFLVDSVQALAKRISLGFLMVAVALSYGLWILSAKLWKNLYAVKDGFVLFLKFGVMPLVIGCWLDFCILPIFGTAVSRRLELVSDCPLVMILHWAFGQLCLLLVFNSMELIQMVSRFSFTFIRTGPYFLMRFLKGILFFLTDLAETTLLVSTRCY